MTTSLQHSSLWSVVVVLLFLFAFFAFAETSEAQSVYRIERIPGAETVVGDFVVGPGLVELELEPGTSRTVNITATNRMGDRRRFDLAVEDAKGSQSLEQPVVLLGDERGPYSLRDYLSFEESSFILNQGERAVIPVTISVPEDAEPGGFYGSVLVSTASLPGDLKEGEVRGSTAIESRIGVLFFVTVPGDVEESGQLKSFTTIPDQNFFLSGPIRFQLLFENTGSVHLTPYGDIRITNIIGEEVGAVDAEPWYALPASTRLKEVKWERPYLFGYYKATAYINRGYDETVDTMEVSFWVLPWKPVAGGVLVLLLVIFLIRYIGKNFQIARKTSGDGGGDGNEPPTPPAQAS